MASDKTAEAALPLTPLPGLRPLSKMLHRLHSGHLRIRLGEHVHEMHGAEAGPSGELRLLRPLESARRIATRGRVGLGEAYMAGDWENPDVTALLHTLPVNQQAFAQAWEGSWFHRVLSPLKTRWSRVSTTSTHGCWPCWMPSPASGCWRSAAVGAASPARPPPPDSRSDQAVAVAGLRVEVTDESHRHNVPAGAESHFKVLVVSEQFDGERLVGRHRRINTLLNDELAGGFPSR